MSTAVGEDTTGEPSGSSRIGHLLRFRVSDEDCDPSVNNKNRARVDSRSVFSICFLAFPD
jgi:hypothetical protein